MCLVARSLETTPRPDESAARGILMLSDGQVELSGLAGQCFRELWGLTETEARVAAAVAQGVNTKTYAAAVGVSDNTVRSQLKSIFAKTGCRRQSDLVRLLWTGPAVVDMGTDITRLGDDAHALGC